MLNLNDNNLEEFSSRWACTICFHANGGADLFCGGCGIARNLKNSQTPPDYTAGMEVTSAITVTLVALFLGGLLLVAVSLFGSTLVSVGSGAYAKLSSTPRPEASPASTIAMPSSANTYARVHPTVPLSPAIPSIPSVPSTKMPEMSEFDLPPSKSAARSTAIVISENANLRGAPSMAGETIIEIPQGSSVKILRQTGPWFRVSFASTEGWLHGNTIELE